MTTVVPAQGKQGGEKQQRDCEGFTPFPSLEGSSKRRCRGSPTVQSKQGMIATMGGEWW